MSGISLWKQFLGQRGKVAVSIGRKTEMLTDTQRLRFSEISEARNAPPVYLNPLDDAQYRIEDAAFRLMIPENEVLARAAAGNLRLYIDATGMAGRWSRRDANGKVSKSSPSTIHSGLLKLRAEACAELATQGRAVVRTLDFCTLNGLTSGLDAATLDNLQAWGPGDKQFLPLHPLNVECNMVVLLPPLSPGTERRLSNE